jgi:hypothetical protein
MKAAKIFLTENSNQQPADPTMNRSMVENTTTTAPNSVFDTAGGGLSRLTAAGNRLGKSHTAGKSERSPTSKYRFIPTENAKFRQFIELMMKSKMTKEDIRDEITKYV